jgi:hypothetical protein
MVLAYSGKVLGAAGATALFGSLFAVWYVVGVASPEVLTGWRAFGRQDLMLAALAVLAFATTLVRPRLVGIDVFAPTIIVLRALFGLVALLLIARRLYAPPFAGGPVDVRAGAYIGLAAAAIVVLSAGLDWAGRPRRANPEPLL